MINPGQDNSLVESWSSSTNHGSPGSQNTIYLSNDALEENIPTMHALMPAYPNPFNGAVTIPFELSSPINTTITIFNVLGEKVMEFPLDNFGTGRHSIKWNGENKLGMRVGTGIYFAKLGLERTSNVQKLIYLK